MLRTLAAGTVVRSPSRTIAKNFCPIRASRAPLVEAYSKSAVAGAQRLEDDMCEQGPDRELVDIPWVAARLGVKVRMVRRLVSQRRIPHLKVGGYVRFERADVERFIEGCRRPPRDEGEEPAA